MEHVDPAVASLVREVFSRLDLGETDPARGKGKAPAGEHEETNAEEEACMFSCDGDASAPAEESTCSICLDSIAPEDTALVKGCDHAYCITCILRWSKRKQQCPKCKGTFEYLWTYRALDGTLNDYLVEESVCLLQRAFWVEPENYAHPDAPLLSRGGFHQNDFLEDFEDYEDDGDYDEDYYVDQFSSRRGRVVVGNRRWGANGYVSSGRMVAAPVLSSSPGASSSSSAARPVSAAKGKGKGGKSAPSADSSVPAPGSSPGPAVGGSPGVKGQGRRARRKEKRAAQDARELGAWG